MPDEDSVTTSVIVPVYNDPEGLWTTVESLREQTGDDYEIIIADNGSTDWTSRLAAKYATNEGIIHIIEDEIQGSYAARNAGIEVSQGELLCFVDADMWVEPEWLEQVRDRMQDETIDYLGCNVEIITESETIFAEYNRQYGFPVGKYIREDNFAPTCCLVVRRHVIEDVGDFDERLISSGDAEFGKRVSRAGYSQQFAEDITMYHPARETLPALLKKKHRIARGQVQRARYHPDLFELNRHPLHPFNFLPIRPHIIYQSYEFDSPREYAITYLIRYARKLATGIGQTREWFFPTRR